MNRADENKAESDNKGRHWLLNLGMVLLALLLGMALVAGWAYRTWESEPSVPEGMSLEVEVRIPKGMTLMAAADSLVAHNLLGNARIFLLGARLTGQDKGLRAGLYALKRGTSPRELLSDLTTGRSVHVKITIPEGLNTEEIAAIVSQAMGFPPEIFLVHADSLARSAIKDRMCMGSASAFASFDSLVRDKSAWVNREPHWCEGYLAPDTYLFAEGTKPSLVAAHLINTQVRRLEQAMAKTTGGLAPYLTMHDLLTLASIIEAEARRDDERAKISAVYTNRLLQNSRLEADPTVAFFLQKKGKRIFFKDLRVPSPFNTYVNLGLPPAPIAAPGFLSLLAAGSPDPQSKNLYFVSDGFDGHVFTRTYEEHQKAVQRFRRFSHGKQY
jgi:UPF0755 protein